MIYPGIWQCSLKRFSGTNQFRIMWSVTLFSQIALKLGKERDRNKDDWKHLLQQIIQLHLGLSGAEVTTLTNGKAYNMTSDQSEASSQPFSVQITNYTCHWQEQRVRAREQTWERGLFTENQQTTIGSRKFHKWGWLIKYHHREKHNSMSRTEQTMF